MKQAEEELLKALGHIRRLSTMEESLQKSLEIISREEDEEKKVLLNKGAASDVQACYTGVETLVRLRARDNREVEVLFREKHWLSVAESNCVVERRGGEQLEANSQSITNKMMNSIRPYALASLLGNGEAGDRTLTLEGMATPTTCTAARAVNAVTTGVHGVVGDGMDGSYCDVNQGSPAGVRKVFMIGISGPKSLPEGDRASIVVKKRGNSRGAKGGRKLTM